jgi:hypothetical protein
MRFDRRKFPQHVLHHRPAYRGKRISVIKAKRRKFVTTPANFGRLPKGYLETAGIFPKFARQIVSFRGEFVKGVLLLAKA